MNRAPLFVLVLLLLAACVMRLASNRSAARAPKSDNPPRLIGKKKQPEKPAEKATEDEVPAGPPQKIGELRVSDDAEQKIGPFWLEQNFKCNTANASGDVLSLYVATDGKTALRLRLATDKAYLELVNNLATAPKVQILTSGTTTHMNNGDNTLGVLWNRELSIWLGRAELFSFKPSAEVETLLKQASGAQLLSTAASLGARRAIPLSDIRFDDSFMRDTADGMWKPVAGKWELTAMAFPERSANPFSMRASFSDAEPNDDALHKGRQRPADYGIGWMLSSTEGTLHIERISGGSPASKAGLAEDDIILEVNGVPATRNGRALYGFGRGYGDQEMTLKIYRPGEKTTRMIRVNNEQYQWGVIAEGTPIKPVAELRSAGRLQYALAVSGESGWADYIAEVAVKPLGAGGMGLVVAATSEDDFVLFRWAGGPERGGAVEKHHNKMQLVRMSAGSETLLAEAAGAFRPYEFYRMAVDWRGDKIRALVDGNEVLAAQVPGLKRGKIGTYAIKGDPVFFDDLHVCSNRELLAVAHRPERQVNSIFALEDDMEQWANPALEWDRNVKTGWSTHRGRFPGEQTITLNKPRFNELRMRLFVGEDPENGNSPLLSIMDGTATITGEGFATVSREIGKGQFEKIVFRASQNGAEAFFDGIRIAASRDGNKTGFPLRNDHVAIYGLKNLGDPAAVKVASANTLEYSFDSAPADWKVECGRWGLLNKWICDPRWSWFGGRTKSLAAIWNKNTFSGDISVDAHVALMMMKDQEVRLHERPGDYNITICGDGVNLDSGYTLIFGGDNNMWTRLYRKGVQVAESIKEEGRVTSDRIRHPDKPQLHQRWFHLKLSKIGNTLSFYRDNVLAFTYNDSDPLPGGRIAFWTMDNGVLVSRVRIAHDGMKPAPFEPRRAQLYEDSRVINQFDGEVFTAVQPVALPAAIRESLSSPAGKFAPATAEPVPPPVAPAAIPRPEAVALPEAYRVTNGTGGGPFALQWKAGYVDPETRGVLRFAYKIEPGAKVDLYLLNVSGEFNPRNGLSGGSFRWRMTGNTESNEYAPLCGDVPGVVADGKWHTVQFDLQRGWRSLWQRRGFFRQGRYSMRLMIGNVDNGGYLLAGMNGNHAGSEYSISDIQIFSPREIDNQAPSIARIIWPYDQDGDGHSITVQFDDPGGSGINSDSLNVNVNEAGIPRELMKFNPIEQTLKLNLLQMNFANLQPGQETRIKIFGFEDRAGNPADGVTQSFAYKPEAALAANKPGPAPELGFKVGTATDFTPGQKPLGLDTVTSLNQGGVRLEEFPDVPPWAAPSQRKSLRVIAANEGASMGFTLNNVSYDMRRWPYLELEYKVPVDSPFNLHIYDGGGNTHALLMTDVEDGRDHLSHEIASRFGPPQDFSADGTWRKSTVPMLKLFSTANPRFDSSFITSMSLHDSGWRAARRDTQYIMHRISAIPAARSDSLGVLWKSDDIAGAADFASVIDDKPDTVPQDVKQILTGESIAEFCKRAGRQLPDGFHYVHVRVKNGAGVWSDTAHRRFCIDNTPPAILKTEPANGARFASQTVRIFFSEAQAIEGSTLKISLNGQPLFRREFELDPAANVLTLNALRAGRQFDPGPVKIEIKSVSDTAGNTALLPLALEFTYDQAQDRTPPAVTSMGFVCASQRYYRELDQEISFSVDFEEHTGHVHALRDCRMEWLDSAPQAGGKRAARFTCLQDDGDVQIMLHRNAWHFDNYPVLHFDYRADAGFKVDIMVEVLGEWYTIKFTNDGAAVAGGKSIGAAVGVVADGQWHHASADLKTMLDSTLPAFDPRIINKVVLSAHGADGCRRGSTLTLDNVALVMRGGYRGYGNVCEWSAADENGIAGYSYVFDQNPATIPPARVNQITSQGAVGGQSGTWYAHVRACDQAGNWSETKTLRLDLGR